MTKAELIAKLEEFFPVHDTPVEVSEDYNVKRYIVNVFKTGKSSKHRVPTGNKQNLHFYVYDEGGAGESAYFDAVEIQNKYDNDLVGSTLEIVGNTYLDNPMRVRVLGATLNAAFDVFNEGTDLLYDASSGQRTVSVTDITHYRAGDVVIIEDDNSKEEFTVSAISLGSGDTGNIYSTTDLNNSYTVSNNGMIKNKSRNEWANNVLLNAQTYSLQMLGFVATNATVQTSGGDATDNDIQYIVNSNINNVI